MMKLKKIVIVLTGVFLLTGCSSQKAAGKKVSSASDSQKNKTTALDDKSVLINGMTVSLDAPFSDVTALLGESQNSESVASCVYDGDEKIYSYDGITVQTYPKDNNEYVSSYKISSDQYKVSGNTQVGSSEDDLKAEYPDGTDTGATYLVDKDTYGRSYTLSDGKVTQIEIYDIVQ